MRSRLTLVGVAVLLTIAVVALSLLYMDPFPPRQIVLVTGQPGGTYDAVGASTSGGSRTRASASS